MIVTISVILIELMSLSSARMVPKIENKRNPSAPTAHSRITLMRMCRLRTLCRLELQTNEFMTFINSFIEVIQLFKKVFSQSAFESLIIHLTIKHHVLSLNRCFYIKVQNVITSRKSSF